MVQNVSFCLARGATILQDNRPDDRQCFSVNKIHQDASCSNHTPHPMWMHACMWTHSAGLTVAACWLDGELDCCSNNRHMPQGCMCTPARWRSKPKEVGSRQGWCS